MLTYPNPQLVRDLEQLGFVPFIGLLVFPIDRLSKVKCKEHIDYSPDNDNWVYYFRNELGDIKYQLLNNPTIEQIKNIISNHQNNEENQL